MLPPPPQETVKNNSIKGASHRYRRHLRTDPLGTRVPGTNNIPSAMVHNHDAGDEGAGLGNADAKTGGGRAAVRRAVVATLMVKVVGVVALNVRLAGKEQVALGGAPVQLS